VSVAGDSGSTDGPDRPDAVRARTPGIGAWLRGAPGRPRGLPALIWLGFIVFPLVDAVETSEPTVAHVLTILAALAFVAAYIGLILTWRFPSWRPLPILLFAVLILMAMALTLADRPQWGFLFTYAAAVAALFSSTRMGWSWVIGCAALAAGCVLLGGGSTALALNYSITSLGIGLLMTLMRDLRERNEELVAARAELAQAAVAQERERFARDLHDLLGHTLSVIALKAELAGRLLPEQPERAATEVEEVEHVARQALSEVRDAVSGYRKPTLDGELAGARMALSAAGIEVEVRRSEVAFAPDVEAVLAWAVREGATNVIRHSEARRCTVHVAAGLTEASVEVIDNGSTTSAGVGDARAGHGLAGLRERAEALGGRLEAGRLPEGGFRLLVGVPVRASGRAATPAPVPSATPASNSASRGAPASSSASPGMPASSAASPGMPASSAASPGMPASNPASPGMPASSPASPAIP
jgi:two-component system sensor histidine kinase DesK